MIIDNHCGDSVLSKTAMFPKKDGRKRESSNESALGQLLVEATIEVSIKGAPSDGHDTANTLRTIKWYKRAFIGQNTRRPLLHRLKTGCQRKCRCRAT